MKKRNRDHSGVTRREFVTTAVVATSGIALTASLPSAFAQSPPCPTETLRKIGEIVRNREKKLLKGVLKITNGPKVLPGYGGSVQPMMRYFEGYDQQANRGVWPSPEDKKVCLPGPTLRAAIGDRVEITFLNQVNVGAFPGGTLDNAETGATTGCDQATNSTTDPPDKNWYPGTRGDSFPNCFHGSSTANLHFHGTHMTPDGFGDNVLVQIRPDPKITEATVEPIFREIFLACEKNDGVPPPWKDVPESFRNFQAAAVRNYDLHAIWKGVRGPVKNEKGEEVPALPEKNQLTPANEEEIDRGLWPQYFVGGFPNCFRITPEEGHDMGQAPGTHWYHSHKHGSTSINLFNGLAGALIIEGKYDADLEKIYPHLKQTEKVLVVQVFEDQPNLERASAGTRSVVTNGTYVTKDATTKIQSGPVIVMKPGEIQLWRIINAQVQSTLNGKFTGPGGTAVSPLPAFRQIAADGVQFKYHNYDTQPATQPDGNKNGTQFTLAAGGRIDILVKAPLIAAGTSQSYELAGIVNLTVCGAAAEEQFPTKDNYPEFPPFLKDLPAPSSRHNYRDLSFDWEPFRLKNGPATNRTATAKPTHAKTIPFKVEVGNDRVGKKEITINASRGPYYMIDDEQFSESKYYQTMILGEEEEWTIINTTSVAHPFHIHINPFQVVEVVDPNTPANSFKRNENGIWHDIILVPAAKTKTAPDDEKGLLIIDEKTGRATTPGLVRIRTKFVDFTGSFVLHCHILAHEDRGMMQLVRVIDKKTPLKHH